MVRKKFGKGYAKKSWIPFLVNDCGDAFQVRGIVHLHVSCCSLQSHCLAVAALFNRAAAGKQWPSSGSQAEL